MTHLPRGDPRESPPILLLAEGPVKRQAPLVLIRAEYPVVMAAPAKSRPWVDEAVDALVREFHPLKIFLFGSRARGDGREESDIDLLVVLERIDDRRKTRDALHKALPRLPVSVDVFAADREELARTGDSVGSFVYPVLREGEVVYGVDDRDEHVRLRYAEEDLEAARRMVEGRGWAPRVACFHAQQAAEKALKAVLVREGIPLQFTHNLELLRDLVPQGRRTASVEGDLGRLSRRAGVPRYPGPGPDATADEAREELALAGAIVEAARADIGS
jgi:HEPN domain-containing protein/predicted nucleotidyltransferase